MWQQFPKRIYKWIRATAVVWDLAIRGDAGFAHLPDDAAQVEVDDAWSKLWQPGLFRLRRMVTNDPSAWNASTFAVKHCPTGKARGEDSWGMGDFKFLPLAAIVDTFQSMNGVRALGLPTRAETRI
eukprot:4969419-Amphidinium_carterae.1